MDIFEKVILGEAAPATGKGGANASTDAEQVPKRADPPNFTNPPTDDGQQQPPDQNVDPNAGGGGEGEQPPDDGQQDPNADPNAAGGDMSGGMGAPESQEDQAEREVFSDLKAEQMAIKNRELKTQYATLHKIIMDNLDKLNKISHTTYDDSLLDLIVRKMAQLKSMIRDSLDKTFDTRDYGANKTELARFSTIYNKLEVLLSMIYKSRLQRNQAIRDMNDKGQRRTGPDFPTLFSREYDVQ